MNAERSLTIRLDSDDFEPLEIEASRRGVAASWLAGEYLHAALEEQNQERADRARQEGRAALKALSALRERLPDIPPPDVVEIIREGREDLINRSGL